MFLAGAAAAASGDAAGNNPATPSLSPLVGPPAGILSGAAQVVGGAINRGAQVIVVTPVAPVLTPLPSSPQSVRSSIPLLVPPGSPGLGVAPGTGGTSTITTVAGTPAAGATPAAAPAGESWTLGGARFRAGLTDSSASVPRSTLTERPVTPAPKRPMPWRPTPFSLLATAGTTGSPSHGPGSSEGMSSMSALLPLLVGGLTPLGGGRHARWLFDARGPPPG